MPALPDSLRPYFPSYELADLDASSDQPLIITNILNYGDTNAIIWLFSNFRSEDISAVVSHPARGQWTKKALNYWRLMFYLDIDPEVAKKAEMDVVPRPEIFTSQFE